MITLTTDFGYRDPFAGVMKGVILGINPAVRIIDITHGIAPQNVMEVAFTIGEAYGLFPSGTIHVVVVDPGVGSGRRPLLVAAGKHFLVGPDNGVFSYVYESCRDGLHVHHVTADHYFIKGRGSTFHGRDVFAPVAAWLSRGIGQENFGPEITDYVRLPLSAPEAAGDGIRGEVIYIDRFGNAITNIREEDIGEAPKARVEVRGMEMGVMDFYAQGGQGGPHAVINSSGLLEIYVFEGSAAESHGIALGDKVTVRAGV